MKPRSPLRKAMDGTLFIKIEQTPDSYGRKSEPKMHYVECKEAIDFCLSCDKEKCGGDCTELKRFKRENRVNGKYKRSTELVDYKPRQGAMRFPYKGEMLTVRELASIADVCPDAMYKRIVKLGKTAEEAVEMGNSHPGYRTRRE